MVVSRSSCPRALQPRRRELLAQRAQAPVARRAGKPDRTRSQPFAGKPRHVPADPLLLQQAADARFLR